MTDEKLGDGTPKPPDWLKNLSPLKFRATQPLRPSTDPLEAPWEQDRDRHAAEVKEPAPGWSWRKVLGIGALEGAAVAAASPPAVPS
jgi:hypothetical protein